ncbi:hypothetical protein LR48_Vigan01g136400 [Vigna angularis]|uniref:Uncharacterized protein n=1 Tax=Phaseolus angularis TaxID=3914 RepID=A0A0L9TMI9_PHAAN|nr:hypothetical protein LR48_Vigan01g136400 [Vigna angularis]
MGTKGTREGLRKRERFLSSGDHHPFLGTRDIIHRKEKGEASQPKERERPIGDTRLAIANGSSRGGEEKSLCAILNGLGCGEGDHPCTGGSRPRRCRGARAPGAAALAGGRLSPREKKRGEQPSALADDGSGAARRYWRRHKRRVTAVGLKKWWCMCDEGKPFLGLSFLKRGEREGGDVVAGGGSSRVVSPATPRRVGGGGTVTGRPGAAACACAGNTNLGFFSEKRPGVSCALSETCKWGGG